MFSFTKEYVIITNIFLTSGRRNYGLADIRGDIESPGFPNLYPDNYNATYILFSIHKLIHLQVREPWLLNTLNYYFISVSLKPKVIA